MQLKCKKDYFTRDNSTFLNTTIRRRKYIIKAGKYYTVIDKYNQVQTDVNGKKVEIRYWLMTTEGGTGHFNIDEYFETPEEIRDKKIGDILE